MFDKFLQYNKISLVKEGFGNGFYLSIWWISPISSTFHPCDGRHCCGVSRGNPKTICTLLKDLLKRDQRESRKMVYLNSQRLNCSDGLGSFRRAVRQSSGPQRTPLVFWPLRIITYIFHVDVSKSLLKCYPEVLKTLDVIKYCSRM